MTPTTTRVRLMIVVSTIVALLAVLTPVLTSPAQAMATPGDIYTWGQNDLGQLGIGASGTTSTPGPVVCCGASGDPIEVIGGRHHSVALAADGTVYAWGQNVHGQVGDGTTSNRDLPTQVLTGQDVVAISAGHYHSMALTSSGELYVWGRNDTSQLGIPGGRLTVPTLLPGFNDIIAATGGRNHSAFVRADGTVWTFGSNVDAQLGNGTVGGESVTPTQVTNSTGIEPIVSVRGGRDVTYAISNDGSLWLWGANSQGAIGDGTRTDRSTPFEATIGGPVVDAHGGAFHSIAVRDDGAVYAWGLNRNGEVGVGTTQSRYVTPLAVTGVVDAVAVGAGRNHSLAIRAGGTVMAWGKNDFGQLGDGSMTKRTSPVTVVGLTDAVSAEGGRSHSRAFVVSTGGGPDTTPPTAAWTSPADEATVSAPVSLVGSATDNVGVTRVEVVIRDTVTGDYWRPATGTWGNFQRFDVAVDSPGAANSSFSFSFDPTGGSGDYRARVWAVDTSANESTANVSLNFNVGSAADNIAPTIAWTAPAANSTVAAPVTLSGTANDNVGVDRVEMIIRDKVTGDYWRPATGTWGNFQRFDVAVDNPGAPATTWSVSFDPPVGGSGQYRARIWAVDTSNNDSIGNGSRNFTVN